MYDTLQAIFIYGTTFSVSSLFFSLANKYKRKKHLFFCFSILAIFILCIVAGVRKETVGTDVLVYAKPVFEIIKNQSSILCIFDYGKSVEPGFLLLAYISSRFSKELPLFLFIIAAVQIIPIYCFAIKKREIINPTMLVFSYMILFYNASFNIMRQCIAAGFVLLSYAYFEERKYINSFVLVLLGCFFHNSTIIAVAITLIAYYLFGKRKVRNILWKLIAISLILIAVLKMIPEIGTFLIEKGFVAVKYSSYIQIFSSLNSNSSYFFVINRYYLVELVCWIIFGIMGINICKSQATFQRFGAYLFNTEIAIIIYLLGFLLFRSSYLQRIGWINMYFILPIFSDACTIKVNSFPISNKKTLLLFCILIIYLFLTCYHGWHGTRPLELIISL